MNTTGWFETFMRDADEKGTGHIMGKGLVISCILLSLLICCSGAAYIRDPLAWHGRFQKISFDVPGDALVHPSVPVIFPDLISKAEAVSIAKANVAFILIYSTTAKLEWLYSLDNPEVPVWVITMKGQITKSYPAEWVTKVVRIDGFTGKVISVT